MTLKLKTPPMPEPDTINAFGAAVCADAYSLEAVVARDAQWLELVGPVVEALQGALVMLPSDDDEIPDEKRIPAGFIYLRWKDLREMKAALRAITEEQE